jgi:hypothetical protein
MRAKKGAEGRGALRSGCGGHESIVAFRTSVIMTSEVMVVMTARPHRWFMKKILPLLVLLPFSVFTAIVIARYGYFGFLTLSFREPWAMQMLIDLGINCVLVGAWIRSDAPKYGIPAVPYLALLPFLGSISALAYFVHRAFKVPAPESRLAAHG